ncbi:MAG: OmpA family protein [Alphaproteobacteria bacterium]|nr:OmpA family protein [Alphaproteobacteria bacterium]
MIKAALLAGALGLAVLPASAQAAEGGNWYLGGFFGPSWAEDADVDVSPPILTDVEVSWDNPGWGGGAALGYDWGHFRLEGEASYRTYDGDEISGTVVGLEDPLSVSGSLDGDLSVLALMVNGAVDFQLAPWFTPYVGAGAGWAFSDIDLNGTGGDDNGFAWQAFVGTAVRLDGVGRWHMTADYRYFNVDSIEFSDGGADIETDHTSHDIMLGLRYVFGVTPPAPAPAPVAAPAPAPAPAPKDYVVYFGFDEDTLTPQAQATVAEVARAIRAGNVVNVRVVGHTDTVGSMSYNQGLSERRARAVRQGLIAEGVSETSINTEGRSFREPAKETGPGVREPLNRRATISF